ncbi:MAG: ECF transporter S component [Clostridia bacterium]|nr:ECF transporter S component [Clostridia bacterium]
MQTNTKDSLRYITKIAILSAMAFVLMLLEFPLPFLAPSFYELNFSDVIALVGGFSLGPIAGVLIELFKIVLNILFTGSDTAFVGEFSNFVMGCAFVLPASLLYRYRKDLRMAVLAMAVGTVALGIVATLLNYYVMIPMYSELYGAPIEAIIGMGAKINPAIGNLWTFVLLAVLPFNLIKGVACSILTFFLYKRVSPLLHK